MKNKTPLLIGILFILFFITGFIVYKAITPSKAPTSITEEEEVEQLPQADPSILVDIAKHASKDNTIVVTAKGLKNTIASVAYELTYESEGLIKGVNSGSKPIDVSGKDAFEREVYLGTCSRNVCKADKGVTKVSLVLEFTDTNSKRSQFSKDFDL